MWPPSRAGSKPCVGTGNRGPGPVMPAPVPPRRKRTARSAVRRAWTENPRRGPGYGEKYPDLVTLEPAEDDEEVFGDAWPMIVEWRELKDVHPNEGKVIGVNYCCRSCCLTGECYRTFGGFQLTPTGPISPSRTSSISLFSAEAYTSCLAITPRHCLTLCQTPRGMYQ